VKEISIPFREDFKDKMLDGTKCKTTRSKKYGESGDIFKIFGATFQLVDVEKKPLGRIFLWDYEDEGFETMAEFIQVWKEIHPKAEIDIEKKFYLHSFKRID